MNLLALVMTCIISSLLISSLIQISRHLLFVNHVNWQALSTVYLKLINQLRLNKIKRLLCLEMHIKLVIVFWWPTCCQHSRLLLLNYKKKIASLVATDIIWTKNQVQRMIWTMVMGIGCCWNMPHSQWQWNLHCCTFCFWLQEKVQDRFIFWSWCSPSKCPCWTVHSNHHVHGQDFNG